MNPLSIFASLFNTGISYFKDKSKVRAAIRERTDELKHMELTTKLETIKSGNLADISMDTNARGQAGWMDDVSFFVFLTPVILAFFPAMVPHVTAGFVAINQMPEWYQLALGMMLVSVWGYRKLVGPIIQSIAKAWLGKSAGVLPKR